MTVAGAVGEHAAAKINLALHVTGRRSDGYHLIESLSAFTHYGDRITVAESDEADRFVVCGPFSTAIPSGGDNLVLKARDAWRVAHPEAAGRRVSIHLEKNLPAASGLGGGSSDAAATLRALERLFSAPRGTAARLAAPLGADVPMCVAARSLVARGVGEVLEPVDGLPTLDVVLVNPGIAVSTPHAFQGLERKDNPPLPPLPEAPDFEELAQWLGSTRNDLTAPALSLAPQIGEALVALGATGARFSRMSGSGATCFGLFPSEAQARMAAATIHAAEPGWFVETTRTRA